MRWLGIRFLQPAITLESIPLHTPKKSSGRAQLEYSCKGKRNAFVVFNESALLDEK